MSIYLHRQSNGKHHVPYVIVAPEQIPKVGKYVAENGTTNATCCFATYVCDISKLYSYT